MRKMVMQMKTCLLIVGATITLAMPAFAEVAAAPKAGGVCVSDVATLCAGIEKKGGGRARCLRANQAKLSPECAKFVASKPAKWGQALPGTAAPAAAPAPAPAAATEKK